MRSLFVLGALGACGPSGQVNVTFLVPDALVASDTSSETARIDADGHAILSGIGSGATVFVTYECGQGCARPREPARQYVIAISGVEPGESLSIGGPRPPSYAPQGGLMTLNLVAPPFTGEYYEASSSCGYGSDSTPPSLAFTFHERCTGTDEDVLVRSRWSGPQGDIVPPVINGYALVHVPLTNGGTFDVQPSRWSPPDPVRVDLVGSFQFAYHDVLLWNDFMNIFGRRSGSSVEIGPFAVVDRPMLLSLDSTISTGGHQSLVMKLPPTVIHTLNVDQMFAPWAVVAADSSASHIRYSIDDAGGLLGSAQLMEANYQWPTEEIAVSFRHIFDPATANSEIDLLELPEALRAFRPKGDVTFGSLIPHRFDDGLTYEYLHQRADDIAAYVVEESLITYRASSSGR